MFRDQFTIILPSGLDQFGIILGTCCRHFGIVLGLCWAYVVVNVLGNDHRHIDFAFWDHFGIVLVSFLEGHVRTTLGPSWHYSRITLGLSWNHFRFRFGCLAIRSQGRVQTRLPRTGPPWTRNLIFSSPLLSFILNAFKRYIVRGGHAVRSSVGHVGVPADLRSRT